jgi:GxxExxY protein
MNADDEIDLQAGRTETYPLKEETRAIIGCAFEVLNGLGHGLNEKCYENALTVEFGLNGIPFEQQRSFDAMYKGVVVGKFVPDLIVHGKIIVDTKVVEQITDHDRGQILNYLRLTRLPIGLILNFRRARLEWERIALTRS